MNLAYKLKNVEDVARAGSLRRSFRERERWPRERLEAFQRERVAELVEHASERSPFYRELYGGKLDRRDVKLESLPTVTKSMMMEQLGRFVTDPRLDAGSLERHLEQLGSGDELFLGKYRVMASSGSSGRRGIYVYDRAAWRVFLAGAMRWSDFLGVGPRLPRWRMAQVAAPDAKHMTRRGSASIAVGMMRQLSLSAAQPVDELVSALERYRPECLMGYPSVIAMLATEQIEGRLRISPAVVCTSSEVRTREMSERIRRAWGVEPNDCLGLTETGITATDCAEHCGMHVFEDACILEVVDRHGRAVPDGEPGEKVFVTNLYNRTQPFIRFEVTDLLTVTAEPCACGRTLRRITSIEGRSDDVLELPGAGGADVRVHPIHLRSPLAAMPAVAQYQIVQRSDGLDVTLSLSRGADPEPMAREVGRMLGAKLGALGVQPLAIRVRIVDRIEREPGAGKLKLIKALPRGAAPEQPVAAGQGVAGAERGAPA